MPPSAADHCYFGSPPLALAHRGGARYAPNVGIENTLRAFENAVALGFRYLETDVHTTSDEVVVAFHDTHLDRVTDRTGPIAALPWRQVRLARVGAREPIPRLDGLLEAFPDARVNIDIKSPGAVGPLWRVIERHAAYDRVCVGSFSDRSLARFRRLAGPRVATAAGRLGTAALRLLPAQLSRWIASPAQVLQIPLAHDVAGRSLPLVTTSLLCTAHRLGKQVHVWTIDDPALMHTLLDLGVDGLVSDRIELLRDVLIERGVWDG
ncbi:MAG: glycerophosphodiester phosphodiesterase [Actinomycetales bacterium]|nr:MAG: glycerophosphodiester phosphodiesterase [Actinomycetales bacterium]